MEVLETVVTQLELLLSPRPMRPSRLELYLQVPTWFSKLRMHTLADCLTLGRGFNNEESAFKLPVASSNIE